MSAALEERYADLTVEFALVAAGIRELVDVVSGEATAVPLRVVLSAVDNPWDWSARAGEFHALKIDNPTTETVAIAFSSDNGATAGNMGADELVPPRTGRVITRPFEAVSIGMDPAVLPAGRSTLFVTLYARQMPPTSYPFEVGIGSRPLSEATVAVAAAAVPLAPPAGASSVLVVPETVDIRYRDDGVAPTAAVGFLIKAGTTFEYDGDLAAFQMISTGAATNVDLAYYG